MLDRINNNSELINQNIGLEKLTGVEGLGVSNPFEDKNSYFIDESLISQTAIDKYQRELDVSKFCDILKSSSQKEADSLVLRQAFEGRLSVDDNDLLADLINSKDFLDDIF